MHCMWITAIMVNHIYRDTFTKVCLEAVYPGIQQSAQLIRVPFHCIRIGKIYQSHSGLPVIGLPYALSICTLQQIAFFCALFEERCALCNIRIDPYTDLQSLVMISLNRSFDIREAVFIPFKVTPVECFHPEAVKMEYPHRNIPFKHTVNKRAGGLFIIIGSKGCRQPQSKEPCRRKRRSAQHSRIQLQYLFW